MASRGNDSDGGSSMTPSEQSDGEERSEHDSDYETDEGKEEEDNNSSDKCLNIVWTGYGKRIPVIIFNVGSILDKGSNFKMVGERYHMSFKFYGADCKIIRNILQGHGFHEVHPNCPDFNVIWTGCHLKPFTLRSLSEFQKVNHFPRSSELTRKDRLFKNVQRMQQIKGVKHFDFLPQTFVMPGEYQEFCSQFLKDRGPWIVKPVASSRGRGVYLVNHPEQVPFDENVIVSHYIHNPLVVDGFKFDLRLYVAVTSYDPLVIYLYEEGLTRFATVKYEKSSKHLRNQCMHLTNYSVNKKSNDYVKNDNPDVEDYGNKWSMGALLRYLRSIGKDTAVLMMRIEDVVIKTLLSVELSIATACKMFMPFRGNCFELYGFDILVDDSLKPWVLEVNLSPSLACDSPLDLKIKGNMLCDLFSLTGIVCHDPMVRSLQQQSRRNQDLIKMTGRAKTACTKSTLTRTMGSYSRHGIFTVVKTPGPLTNRPIPTLLYKARPLSAAGPNKTGLVTPGGKTIMTGLNSEEIKIVRRVKEEEQRKGGWIRIFPGPDTWDVHGPFLQFNTSHNMMLHQRLYPERHKYVGLKSFGNSSMSAATRSKNGYLQVMGTGQRMESDKSIESYTLAMVRASQYERKLGSRARRRRKDSRQKDIRGQLVQGMADEMEYGEQQSEEEYEQIDGRGRQDEEEDKKPVRMEPVRLAPYESGQAPVRQSKALIETRTQEVRVEVSHPLPASLTQSSSPFPAPSSSPSRPQKWDIIELVTKGGKLSKVQARSAFAMYLRRVKERLMSDTGSLAPEDEDTLNEQMDLVLRFLKRAAVNLQQTFRVVIPSRKLTLGDRRHILAKQLADFVHIYNRETDQLKNQLKVSEKTGSRSLTSQRSDSESSLDDAHFNHFIAVASESDLEHMLTTYTKLNKSSSIFLGSSITSSASPSKPPHVPLPPPQVQRFDLMQRRREGGEGEPQSLTGASGPLREYSTSCVDSQGTVSAGSLSRPGSAASTTAVAAAAAAAATSPSTLSSKKLGRPHSASNYKSPDLQTHVAWTEGNSGMEAYEIYPLSLKLTSRPSSAKPSPFSTSEPVVDTYNEEAIREALQRLTVKQQARQYAAGNKPITLQDPPPPPASRQAAAAAREEQRHQRGCLSPLDEHTTTDHHPTTHPGTLQRSSSYSSRPGSGTSRASREGQGESTPGSVSLQLLPSSLGLRNRAPNMDYGFFTITKPEPLVQEAVLASTPPAEPPDPKSPGEAAPTHAVVSVTSSRSNSRTSVGEKPDQFDLTEVPPGSAKKPPPYPQIIPEGVGHSEQEVCEGQKGAGRKEKQQGGKKPPGPGKEGLGSKPELSTSACSAGGGGGGGGGGERVSQGQMNAVGELASCVGLSKQAPLSLSGSQLTSQLLPSRGYANQGGDYHAQSTQKTQSLKWSSDLKSRMAMEASKAKHHAMVAQAHAAQRVSSSSRLLREASKPPHALDLEGSIARGAPTFSPRPPAMPASSSRSQPSVPSKTSRLSAVENLSHSLGFHSSLKHDIHTLLHRKAQTNAGH